MNQSIEERQGLLRKALTGNAVFSVVSGVAILFANRWLVKFLGLPEKVSLAILGISLIVYAIILWLNAHRPKIKITDAWVAVIMDAVWVVGSYVLIFVVPFSVGESGLSPCWLNWCWRLLSCNGSASARFERANSMPSPA